MSIAINNATDITMLYTFIKFISTPFHHGFNMVLSAKIPDKTPDIFCDRLILMY